MDEKEIQKRIQTLKQEIDDLRGLNELYWQGYLPSESANYQHEKRRERLQQIRDELRSLGKFRTVIVPDTKAG